MADGRVVIDVVVNDEQLRKLDGSLGTVEKSTDKVATGAKNMAVAMLAVKAVSKIFDVVSQSLDAAISRFDTMKQYPKVMEMVGFSAEQSERSVQKLSDGIQGLPTRLDEVVSTAQGLAVMTGDINKATDLTLALNNAFLASGASSADAARGLTQYQQMLAKGKVDMQSWHTIQETMPVALKRTAEAFGFAGDAATSDFYDALKDGEITFDQFGDKLIELSNETGGFADMALESSKGIATSMQNVKTAVVNGLTVVIEAFDNMLREVTGKGIAEHLDNLKVTVGTVFQAIGTSIEQVTPIVKFFYEIFKTVINFIAENTEIVVGLVTAFATFKIIESVNGWITTLKSGLETLYLVLLDVTSGTDTFLGALSGMSGSVGGFADKISSVPGIVATAVGATVGLMTWYVKEQEKRNEELFGPFFDALNDLENRIADLGGKTNESTENHKANADAIDQNTSSVKKLADRTFELAKQQNRTGAETKELEENIKGLNDEIGQEVIFYNEKTGAISTTAGELSSYLDLMKAENQLALEKERQVEVDEQLVEATKLKT
ncbi:MAG: tape measure protein, partial [Christensenellaceae bacterium]|nr:tape measure protein [Christensenellaceae bacterium]